MRNELEATGARAKCVCLLVYSPPRHEYHEAEEEAVGQGRGQGEVEHSDLSVWCGKDGASCKF